MEVPLNVMRKFLLATAILMLPAMASAQGRIAVVDLEQAILQTDYAQSRLAELESNENFASDKTEFDALREELEKLVETSSVIRQR
jgi:outer membrane protein